MEITSTLVFVLFYGVYTVFMVALIDWQLLQFYLKLTVFVILLLSTTIVPFLSFLAHGISWENTRFIAKVWRILRKRVFGIHVKMVGMEHILRERACVIVCNKQSIMDYIILTDLWICEGVFCLLPWSRVLWAVFGPMLLICGVKVRNSAGLRSTINALKLNYRRQYIRPVLFVEGSTSLLADEACNLKEDPFVIATQAKVPVIPVVISSYHHLYHQEKLRFLKGTVVVTVLPATSTEGMTEYDVGAVTLSVQAKMNRQISQRAIPVNEDMKSRKQRRKR